jgi:hypothetical protein
VHGDSVGHHEGDTMIMIPWESKSAGFSSLHVVERHQLFDYEAAKNALDRTQNKSSCPPGVNPIDFDPNCRGRHLQLQITVEDPGVFTTPWTA